MAITLYSENGPLSNEELDENFNWLNENKVGTDALGNNELLYRDKDGNLTSFDIDEQELVGRLTGENIKALNITEVKTLLAMSVGDIAGLPQWKKATISYTDLVGLAPGTSGFINLETLDQNSNILAMKIVVKTAFVSGSNSTATFQLGVDTPSDSLGTQANILATGITGAAGMLTNGYNLTGSKLRITAECDTDIQDFTDGEADVYYYIVKDANAIV